ncbi:MAG: RluA family pseudouridine synthase [bacterium]
MKTFIIDAAHENQRIDKYLKKLLSRAPASLIYKMLRKKDVKVNGKRVKENYIVKRDDVVELFLYEDQFAKYSEPVSIYDLPVTFSVVYEDEHILIVNKPAGLLVHEDSREEFNTLSNQVLTYLYNQGSYDPEDTLGFVPGPVHRLDRNTSGLVIFGKDMRALQDLNEMMKKRHCITKKYLTIVKGRVDERHLLDYVKKDEKEGRMYLVSPQTPGALKMETYVRPIKTTKEMSLVEVEIITGRTHQIRVHLAAIHHPVMGDRKYGDYQWNQQVKKAFHLNHQFLHAHSLTFTKPFGSLSYLAQRTFQAPLPVDLERIEKSCFPNYTNE